VDTENDASEFDCGHYGKLLEKAWEEVAFAFFGGVPLPLRLQDSF
jgi:hypothetical protein